MSKRKKQGKRQPLPGSFALNHNPRKGHSVGYTSAIKEDSMGLLFEVTQAGPKDFRIASRHDYTPAKEHGTRQTVPPEMLCDVDHLAGLVPPPPEPGSPEWCKMIEERVHRLTMQNQELVNAHKRQELFMEVSLAGLLLLIIILTVFNLK